MFELFVQEGFSDFELASVIAVLQGANGLCQETALNWRVGSDTPGLIAGAGGMMVRAVPAIPDHFLADYLIVIGGENPTPTAWMKRARSMRRKGRPVVLLSSAASHYIESTSAPTGAVTTHWQDAALLTEMADYPKLSLRLAEKSGGIITSAGAGYACELVICLLGDLLTTNERAELANILLLDKIRPADAPQPRKIGENTDLFEPVVGKAIRLMEESLADPIPMADLADQLHLSARQLERKFNLAFQMPPARFYKKLRLKQARALLLHTQIRVLDAAIATGFSSTAALSRSLREQYGETCTEIRQRKGARSAR